MTKYKLRKRAQLTKGERALICCPETDVVNPKWMSAESIRRLDEAYVLWMSQEEEDYEKAIASLPSTKSNQKALEAMFLKGKMLKKVDA